ncbi:ribosomal protein L7/L12 [Spiroplasma endosymbiont of Nebria brevicollis]|uniref:ribosomal protein L7/L12 n=1 Tax=Spiroplasma endosymbiont of Nebria brevicollis TaxID=3066284 RepID=UPI00313EC792
MENITTKQFIEHIKTMTALQLKDLVIAIEEAFGVTAAVATAAAPVQEVEAKPTTVSLILKLVGDNKVGVIKAVKTILGADTSLIAAKKIVDAVSTGPQKLLENIDAAKAAEFEAVLKVVGAIAEAK